MSKYNDMYGIATVATEVYKNEQKARNKMFREMIDNMEYSSGQLGHPDEATTPDQSPILASVERLRMGSQHLDDMIEFVNGRMNDVIGIIPQDIIVNEKSGDVKEIIQSHYSQLIKAVDDINSRITNLDHSLKRMKEL